MALEITLGIAGKLLPQRSPDAHKGTFGHVFVVAGSRGFTGAVKMCCDAAMRSGAGLVTCGIPAPLGDVIGATLYEPMSLLLPATEQESLSRDAVGPALEFAEGKDAVVLGPGLSRNPQTQEFVLEFVRRVHAPMLIDADGLNALSGRPDVLLESAGPRVLTPHPGEMARLVGMKAAVVAADRESVASAFAARYLCALVLKGRNTLVVGPGQGKSVRGPYVNTTGNSGLASGGTGDVLSGVIGGLMAQGMDPLDAAVLGVYAHGLAGDLAAAAKTQRGMIASDVINALPDAWRLIEQDTLPL
ncbi:MAG: NAD(P)H-hydrate dehydratase [Burkholderiales bacterium]|nr:NAD(P)H-hydrate dehydratase [Burkholderiales bacterium]